MIRKLTADGKPVIAGRVAARDHLKRYRWEIYLRRAGRRIHRIIWAHTEADAWVQADSLKRKGGSGITWTAGLNLWRQAKQPSVSHWTAMERNVSLFVSWFGDLEIEETTDDVFSDFLERRAKVSDRTAQYARNIRTIARWLRSKRLLMQIPFEHVPGFKCRVENPRRVILNARDYLNTLPPRARRIVKFILCTGLRSSEACNLDHGDVVNGIARFRQKGGTFRTIALDVMLTELVGSGAGPVFPNSPGTRWDANGLLHYCKRWWVSAGLPPIRIHELRHTFATLAAKAGMGAQELKDAMGWASSRMADNYVHLAGESQSKARRAVVAFLWQNRPQVAESGGENGGDQGAAGA